MKLDESAMEDAFFEGTCLLGIVSALPPYRLCWIINRYFDIDFACMPDMTLISSKKQVEYYYMIYEHCLPNSEHRYLLYQLKNKNLSLLPELAAIDYLWLIQTGCPEDDGQEIAARLRAIPDIQLVRVLHRDQLKNARSLLV